MCYSIDLFKYSRKRAKKQETLSFTFLIQPYSRRSLLFTFIYLLEKFEGSGKKMAASVSSPVSPTATSIQHRTQRGIDSSFDYPNGSSSRTSLRGAGAEDGGGGAGQTNSRLSNGTYKRVSSSSSSGNNALPPGAPNGSRINTVTYKVSESANFSYHLSLELYLPTFHRMQLSKHL